MGLATTFVLLGSSIVISLLKKVIPNQVRLPAFIVIIAGFVTIVGFLLQVYLPDLYSSLGVFLSLITVNCIILGRAEAFASKNSVGKSIADALGMGIGFTLALFLMGSIREILGQNTWFGIDVSFGIFEPCLLYTSPPHRYCPGIFRNLHCCRNHPSARHPHLPHPLGDQKRRGAGRHQRTPPKKEPESL